MDSRHREGFAAGVFVKAPHPGDVKTRLAAVIGLEAAARVYRAFLLDLARELRPAPGEELVYFVAPDAEIDSLRSLVRGVSPGGDRRVRWLPQGEGDLGERMQSALQRLLALSPRALLIGSDLPTIRWIRLRAAAEALASADLVLGPSEDGGYYLVGARTVVSHIFEAMPWSTAAVLPETLRRARHAGLSVELLPTERDVDTVEDLEALWSLLRRDPGDLAARLSHTRAACRRVFERDPGEIPGSSAADGAPGRDRKSGRNEC